MKKFLPLLALPFFILTAALSCGAEDTASSTLRVGVILPSSGDAASVGDAFRNGMQLAIETLSPEDRKRLEFHFEDDALSSTKAVSAFHKLLAQNKIQALVNLSSGTGNALAPLAERHKLPFISVASDVKIVKGRTYPFNLWVTPEEEARVLIPEALRRGYRKVARITAVHEGTYVMRSAMDAENKGKLQFQIDEEVTPDVKDFKTILAKIKTKKELDAIHLILFPGQLSSFAKQARSMGITLPFFSWEFLEDANEIKNSDGALVDAWYVNADNAAGDFNARYLARFPGASLFAAANGYDTVLLLAEAAKRDASSEGVRNFLQTLKDFSGALGRYSATGDNRFTLGAAVKEVTKDGFRKLGTLPDFQD